MRRIVDDFISEFATGTGFSRTPAAYQVGAGVEIGIEHGLNLTPMVHSDAARGCLSDPVVKSICEVDMDCTAHACAAAVILAEYARLKYGLFDQSPDNESGTGRQTETGRDTDGDGSMRPTQRNREVGDLASAERRMVKQANRAAEADEMGTKEYLKRHGWRTGPKPEQPDEVIDRAAADLQRYDEEVDNLDDAMNQPGGMGYAIAGSDGDYHPVILRPDLQNEPGHHSNLIGDGFTYYAGGGTVRLRYNELESDAYTQLIQSKRLLADALGMNRRSANSPNLLRGRLHGSKLARVPTGNRRAFRRIDKPRKKSYAVLIGVDLSGSTGGSREVELRRMAYAQASLLDSLGIRFAVAGHTGCKYRTDAPAGSRDADLATAQAVREVRQVYGDGNVGLATHKLAKNFAEPWDESAKLAMAAFQAASANLDGITMQTYINMLCTQPVTDRILLYYTDGQMPAEDHSNQLTILKRQLRRARAMAKLPNHRLHVVGIALDNDAPKKYGLDTILVDSDKPDESVRLVVEGLAERIARSINK
jgi:cobalamin biosynthesis protein CobT